MNALHTQLGFGGFWQIGSDFVSAQKYILRADGAQFVSDRSQQSDPITDFGRIEAGRCVFWIYRDAQSPAFDLYIG
jgi:hypothetical protein